MKFAVIGLGLFGKRLARELANLDHQVLAIDRDEQSVSAVQDDVNKAVIGDVTQEGLLAELITDDFDTVIVTMATELEASLLSVLHARQLGVENVIAKSNGPDHSTILRQLGIKHIISPEEDVAEQLAEEIGNPRVHEYLEIRDGQTLVEMTVPDFFVGKSLAELNLRNEHQIQVIGVNRANERGNEVNYVPSPSKPFEEEDVVWVTGPKETLDKLSHNE